MKALIILLIAAGCATEGTPLRDWTFDATGASPTAIELPGKLPTRPGIAFTMRATVPLAPGARGVAHALVVDCFHGPLALRVNGSEAESDGGVGAGSWRFVLTAEQTRGAEVELVLAGASNPLSSRGFGAVPRLIANIEGDLRSRAISAFNRYSAIVALLLVFALAIPYVAMYLLDRRRSEYAAILVYGISVVNVPLATLGVYDTLFGAAALHVSNLLALINYVALLYSIHLVFELEPVNRRWLVVFAAFAGLTAGAVIVPPIARAVLFLHGPLTLIVNGYVYWRLVRLARGSDEHRLDAQVTLVAATFNAVSILQGAFWIATGVSPLGGVHPLSAGTALIAIVQAVVLARQHVQRQRTIAATHAELQRQVAERSRELSEALSKLAEAPFVTTDDQIIDERYQVIGRLGAGGMGTVYEVERLDDGKRLALKLLRGRGDSERMSRFAREAQLAAELAHPNLMPVLDVGVTDGTLFLVMPLVSGGSLANHRSKFGDAAWARYMLAQVAAGLAALHAKGIVHRDLKLANVLLEDGVLPRITDLGLAAVGPGVQELALDDTATITGNLARASRLTRVGDVFGTPAYMAPELASGVHDVKPSADIFSFGIMAYEMLTGEPPFAEPPIVTRLRGAKVAAPELTSVPDVVARCLDLDPDKRPTAEALAKELA